MNRMVSCFAVFLVCVSAAEATILTGGWSASNKDMELLADGSGENYGSRITNSPVAYSGDGNHNGTFSQGIGWTPHICLTWVISGDDQFDTYQDWDGRGDVVQIESAGPCDIILAPDSGYKALVHSFILDEWDGGGAMSVNWSILDARGTITNGTWSKGGSGRDTIYTGLTAADLIAGNAVTLRLTRTSGSSLYLAMDNLDFQEVHTDGVPKTTATETLLTETWDNSGGHTRLPHANWQGWAVGASEPDVNGSDWWTTEHFAGGSYPTDVGFLNQSSQTVTKQLSGAGSTFVKGRVYALQFAAFSGGNYGSCRDSSIFWRGTLLADGSPVAADNWFSDEFSSIPGVTSNRIITVNSSSDGLTTCKILYRASAADAGKTIGVQLAGPDFPCGGRVAGGYYAWYDNVSLTVTLPVGTCVLIQ